MSWATVVAARLRGLFEHKRLERELDDEVRFHLEMQIEDNLKAGMNPAEARYAALRSFGGLEPMKETYRERRTFALVETTAQDLRYAVRTLRKSPGFTMTAVAVLALAIGANTAMFSVLNAVLLRPLPYRSPEQLAMLWTEDPTQNLREGRSALWDVEQWRSQSQSFADMATFDAVSTTLTGADGVEQIVGASISPNLLPLLGVQPVLGRSFSTEEAEQRQRLVLISHRFWQARFGGSHDAIGATLVLNGFPSQIIGILPADFQIARLDADVWEPHTSRRSRARRRNVVRRWTTSTDRDVRPGPGGDERNRPPPQRSIAGGRKEPGHQRRPIESLHGRTPIAIGIVDARRRRVLRVPHRRCQRHKPLAGAQRRPRARDGRSRCARSECRTDRATAAHRKRPARRRLGTDWHTARLSRHSPHPRLRPWQPAASE